MVERMVPLLEDVASQLSAIEAQLETISAIASFGRYGPIAVLASLIAGALGWWLKNRIETSRRRKNVQHALFLDIADRRMQYRNLYLSLVKWVRANIDGVDIDVDSYKITGRVVILRDRIHYEKHGNTVYETLAYDVLHLFTKNDIKPIIVIYRRFEKIEIYMMKLDAEIARYRETYKDKRLPHRVSDKLITRVNSAFLGFKKMNEAFAGFSNSPLLGELASFGEEARRRPSAGHGSAGADTTAAPAPEVEAATWTGRA